MRFAPLLLAAVAALAHADEAGPRIGYERYRLPNGLTVILHEDHRVPQVVVDLWFHVGSKDEKPRRTGFAHLFEHLMFMGTKNVPGALFDKLMERSGGWNNASTSEDRTNYFEVGPSELLETFLWLEADRLSSLPEAMTQAKLDLQRDVVKNERRQTVENKPYGKVELILPEHLYPVGHPYHHPVIGSHADLTAAGVGDVKAFFRDYYVPANATLVVAGDFKGADGRALVERYFGWMPRLPEPAHAIPPPARLAKSERVVVTDAVELAQVTLAFVSPPAESPGDAECELLAALLGAGQSSRLSRALVFEQRLAESVEVEQRADRYGGEFVIVATARPGHDAAELERAIDAELARLGREPPSEREVERARALTEARKLEELEPLFGRADRLAELDYLRGDPGELSRSLTAKYRQLGPGDLAWQAHAVLDRPRITIVVTPRDQSGPLPKGRLR